MNETQDRPKFPRSLVLEVFLELGKQFDPQPDWVHDREMDASPGGTATACPPPPPRPPVQRPHAMCERFCAVGGFRRGKQEMKDLEILYIPRFHEVRDVLSLFVEKAIVNITEAMLNGLIETGVLVKRHKCDGSISAWGPENKHAVHVASGLPIDFFAATEENYFNRLVVTTGPAELNIRIAGLARKKSHEWEVYEAGFVQLGGTWENSPHTRVYVKSERDVFDFVGLPYAEPENRHRFLA